MNNLINVIKEILPIAISNINTVRIPALEIVWGRSFSDEMKNEDQITVEVTKNYSRMVNNEIFRQINSRINTFHEHTTNGSDYCYIDQDGNKYLIEDKNSFSIGNGWVGNGFEKTPIHLLKKFKIDKDGRIIEAFVALVDISKCISKWSDKTLNTNRSVISFINEDAEHIQVIHGSITKKRKNIQINTSPL